jgi:AraC-like DNA-binding protein
MATLGLYLLHGAATRASRRALLARDIGYLKPPPNDQRKMVPVLSIDHAAPTFWRDDTLPFVEARSTRNGHELSYARHAHETFSIGAITAGRSSYFNRVGREPIGAGSVVMMNPGDVHACNPVEHHSWAYRMLYVDAGWLTTLQHELGLSANAGFRAFSTTATTTLFGRLNRLYDLLTDAHAEHLEKSSAAIAFFSALQQQLDPAPTRAREAHHKLLRAAEFIDDNFRCALRLDAICAASGLSASYLIRAFNEQYGMTPHSYLINRRIQYGQQRLRRGHRIADVALDAGFADQAHFQRAFKQLLAATPGQYRAR